MEIKDSAIMLFGKMIALDLQLVTPAISDDEDVMKEAEDDEGQETEQSSDKETGKSKDPEEKDKVLKKPDKILPCSRCNSMDTKFCYYNNYNVNQPRHFCKSCQRYWTAGGTMRNVPVGAGRRKSKSASAAAAACYHQFPTKSRTHGTVLSFGSESRTQRTVVEDSSSESTVTTMSNPVDESNHHQNFNGFSVPPWPYNVAVPFYPGPAFWTCPVPTAWSLPWPPSYPSSEKRFRDGDDLEPERPKKVLIPKTLRMDDPDEAAKSSIWATLGIKNDGFAAKGGFFKGSEKSRAARAENSVVLCANPAALSRSLNFHERI